MGKKNEIENWRSTTTSKAATYINIQNEMENGIESLHVKQVVLFLYHLWRASISLSLLTFVHDLKEILKALITLGAPQFYAISLFKEFDLQNRIHTSPYNSCTCFTQLNGFLNVAGETPMRIYHKRHTHL